MLNTNYINMTRKCNYNNFNNHIKFPYQKIWRRFFGVFFDKEENCNVKLFTFADTTKVIMEVKPLKENAVLYELQKTSDCIWQTKLTKEQIKSGDRYRFIITYKNKTVQVKDPCSMWQDSYFKWSRAYNHNNFKWTDDYWQENKNPEKVSRLSTNNNILADVKSLRIYELHIGTFTEEGTFKSAKEKLKYIAEELGFNAIEIMPVENTYSFNWGYDGVDKYAPNNTYGTPDDLKDLINYAHKIGLNVIMDVVPNHLGPDLAELHLTGPYTDGTNCFGFKFNFENQYGEYTRDYIIGSCLNWIMNYHCDGLRVDMTKFMASDYTMKQMAAEINFYNPDAFLIAEDGRDNDGRVTRIFPQKEIDENEHNHEKFIDKIKKNSISLNSLGFDSEWDFVFHKQIASTVLGAWEWWKKDINNFDKTLYNAQTRVKYVMSHDEIGNIDGTRLITKIITNELNLYNNVVTDSHSDKCKISAQAGHEILKALITGKLDNMSEIEKIEFFNKIKVSKVFSTEEIFEKYLKAINMHKMAIGKIYSIPGPKMVFQGDEDANLAHFKFFRKFSTGPEPYLLEKGYKPGIDAMKDSKLDAINVSEKYSYINDAVRKFVSDLNNINKNNIALSSGHIVKTYLNQEDDVHAIHCKKIYNEIFSISNFSNVPYYKSYGVLFPPGNWKEILNSDDIKYTGEGKYTNPKIFTEKYNYISVPAYGTIIFEKIN